MTREPRTARGRETRRKILQAAADLMHLHGVHGTSVDDVLEASGTGKSQFYLYFESKDALVRAVLRFRSEEWHAAADKVLGELDSWEGFEEWFRRTLKRQESTGFRGGCPIGSLAAEMADADDDLRLAILAEFDTRRSKIVSGLQRMKDRGALHTAADPVALGDFVMATLQGGLLLSATEKTGRALENALQNVMTHLRSQASDAAETTASGSKPPGGR